MNPFLIVDSTAYLMGEHGTFACDDCHSPDYATYPHNAELKLEPKYTCQDCHAGDDAYAHLHFDEIETEVQNSVHAKAFGETFRCEMCHDPHTNRLIASSNKYSIREIVVNNNATCLFCHGETGNFQMYTDKAKPIIDEAHEWLPNQSLHFRSVRCIECHSSADDTLMVAHNILPKNNAVKNCAQCHSKDNMLTAKLYKYMNKASRGEDGVYAATLSNESYIIGAHRNKLLNIGGIALIGLTLLGITIHIILRISNGK